MNNMEQQKIPLIVVAGPTASGKTGLAVALAKAFDGEVVSADSMQIYQKMNIATAKPTTEEMQGVRHHLLDFLPPDAPSFSVAEYAQLAHAAIEEIAGCGKQPILAGGTGLYIRAVTDNIAYAEMECDPALREELRQMARELGGDRMLELLRECDPVLADKLHPNDLGRILRAIEVCRITGVPMSEQQRLARETEPRYRLCMLGLCCENRAVLYDRINRRVDEMVAQGLVEEARQICAAYGGTARQAIGYKELAPYLQAECTLEESIERLKQATRNYAKRQLSWFRRDERIQWLKTDLFAHREELLQEAQMLVHKCRMI